MSLVKLKEVISKSPAVTMRSPPDSRVDRLLLCCGRAFLSSESLHNHRRDPSCRLFPQLSPAASADDNDSFPTFSPQIESVSSLSAHPVQHVDDIEEVEIIEEEPRPLADNGDMNMNSRNIMKPSDTNDNNEPSPVSIKEDSNSNSNWENYEDEEWEEEDIETYGDIEIEYEEPVDHEFDYEDENFDSDYDNDNQEGTFEILGQGEEEGPGPSGNKKKKHKCKYPGCAFTAATMNNLASHVQHGHVENGGYPCNQCVCVYKSKQQRNRHLKHYHGLYNTETNAEFSAVRTPQGRKCYQCKTCLYVANSIYAIRDHAHSAHDPAGEHPCPHCTCRYVKKSKLTQHLNLYHPEPQDGRNSSGNGGVIPDRGDHEVVMLAKTDNGQVVRFQKVVLNNQATYKCRLCDYRTEKLGAIVRHAKGSHIENGEFACQFCPCRFDEEVMYVRHISYLHSNSNAIASTSTPRKTSASASNRKVPKPSTTVTSGGIDKGEYTTIVHGGAEVFKCNSCRYGARSLEIMENHLLNAHGPQSKHICDECSGSVRFMQAASLALHYARYHKEKMTLDEAYQENISTLTYKTSRIYQCKLCFYVHATLGRLVKHVALSHAPDGQYRCSECSCQFVGESDRDKHVKLMHRFQADNDIVFARLASSSPENVQSPINKSPPTTPSAAPTVPAARATPPPPPPAAVASTSTSAPNEHREAFATYRTIQVSGKPQFICNSCGMQTKGLCSIKGHVKKAHNPSSKFKCPYCSCRYSGQSRLSHHLQLQHSKAKGSLKLKTKAEMNAEEEEEKTEELNANVPLELEPVAVGPEEPPIDEGGFGYKVVKIGGRTSFHCTQCSFTGKCKTDMEEHKVHSLDRKFVCQICNYRFNLARMLKSHITKKHSGQKIAASAAPIKIPLVSQLPTRQKNKLNKDARTNVVDENSFKKINVGGKVRFKCTVGECAYLSINQSNIRYHLLKSHDPNRTICCIECPARFSAQYALDKHMKEYHSESPPKTVSAGPPTTVKNKMDKPPTSGGGEGTAIRCNIVGCAFKTVSKLDWVIKQHMQNAHSPTAPYKCSLCPCRYNFDDNLQQHVNTQHGGRNDGDFTFHNDNNATSDDHDDEELEEPEIEVKAERTEGGSPPQEKFSCNFCPFRGKNKEKLVNHLLAAHSSKNTFQCESCSCRFATAGGLKVHRSQAHIKNQRNVDILPPASRPSFSIQKKQKVRKPTPSLLSYRPSQKLVRRASRTLSTGMHTCESCGDVFTNKVSLEWHVQHKHSAWNPNRTCYTCKVCGSRYDKVKSLHQHMGRQHKGVPWDSPEVEASTHGPVDADNEEDSPTPPQERQSLKTKWFTCSKCPYVSKLRINLRRHQNNAHVENGVRCPHCPCSFAKESEDLTTHIVQIHKGVGSQEEVKDKGEKPSGSRPSTSTSKTGEERPIRILQRQSYPKEDEEGATTRSSRLAEKEKQSRESTGPQPAESESKRRKTIDTATNTTPARTATGQFAASERKRRLASNPLPDTNNDEEEEEENSPLVDPLSDELPIKRMPKKVPKMSEEPQSEMLFSDTGRPLRKSAQNATKVIAQCLDEENAEEAASLKDKEKDKSKHHKLNNVTKQNQQNQPPIVHNNVNGALRARRNSVEALNEDEQTGSWAKSPIKVNANGYGKTTAFKEFMRFLCSRCGTGFDTNMKLTAHFQHCDREAKEFPCGICSGRYPSLVKLKEHLWETHMTQQDQEKSVMRSESSSGVPLYACSLCKLAVFDRKSFIMHISVPHLFRCKKCAFVCNVKSVMEGHKQEHKRNKLLLQEQAATESTRQDDDDDDIQIVSEIPLQPPQQRASQSNVNQGEMPTTSTASRMEMPTTSSMSGNRKLVSPIRRLTEPDVPSPPSIVDDEVEEKPPTADDETREEACESLICTECGHFSNNIEEAREHSKALASDASLICSICAYIAETQCDSVIHNKTHQTQAQQKTEDGEKEKASELFEEIDNFNNSQPGPGPFQIQLEFGDGNLVEGGQNIEIVQGNHVPSDLVLLDLQLDLTQQGNVTVSTSQ